MNIEKGSANIEYHSGSLLNLPQIPELLSISNATFVTTGATRSLPLNPTEYQIMSTESTKRSSQRELVSILF